MAKDTFAPLSFFALRAPAFSFSSLFQKLPTRETAEAWRTDFGEAWFRESLRIASSSLSEVLEAWLNDAQAVLAPRDYQSLLRYYLRMSYRATPFGLFAGLGMATWESGGKLHLAARSEGRRADRLDMGWLHAFVQRLHEDPALLPHLRFFTNNTVYASGDRWRYVEELVIKGSRRHQLTDVTRFEELDALLDQARQGATLPALMQALVAAGHSEEDSQAFLLDMVSSQLLISELALPVTGPEAEAFLADKLAAWEATSPLVSAFFALRRLVSAPADSGIRSEDYYQQLAEMAKPLAETRHVLQTDWALPLAGKGLPPQVLGELKRAIKLLQRLAKHTLPPDLKQFSEAFAARFGEESVPLLEALDTEKGLGYPLHSAEQGDEPALVEGLAPAGQEEVMQVRLSAWQKYLLNRALQVQAEGKQELVLSESELDEALGREEGDVHHFADTFYSNATLLAPSVAAMETGDFQWLLGATGGSSLAPTLGRFTHLQPHLAEAIQRAHREEGERYEGAVLAEIVHSPADRVGNVMQRAALRDYEIPVLTASAVEESHTLRLQELSLHLHEGRLVLWSNRLGKEVIPRLSNAHNFLKNSIPVYRFLGDFQYAQIQPNVMWQWTLGDVLHFTPRIRVGKVVVSPAKWSLDYRVWQQALSGQMPSQMPALPDWVLMVEGDQQLPLYLAQATGREMLLQAAKKHGRLVVEELLETPDQLWLEGADGRYTNQMVIPWRSKAPALTIAPARPAVSPPPKTTFVPGSEWLSLKVYGGFKTLDQLLAEALLPWVNALVQDGQLDTWFFLRYQDPEYHLRLRLHVAPGADQGRVWDRWQELSAAWLQAGMVQDAQVDTYRQEWRRYGPDSMAQCEQLFGLDSARCAQWLGLLDAQEGDGFRWKMALLGIDHWYNLFGYTLAQRAAHSKAHAEGFGREFRAGKAQKKTLSQRYQQASEELEQWLLQPESLGEEVAPIWEILQAFHQQAQPQLADILALVPPQRPDTDGLLASLIHMFVNRLLRSQPRKQEWVLYDLLHSHYRKQVALDKKKG